MCHVPIPSNRAFEQRETLAAPMPESRYQHAIERCFERLLDA
jgi:hypothetical protein